MTAIVTTDLTTSAAADLADLLARGDVSAREVTQACLDRTRAVDGAVHAYLHVDEEGALAAADDIDRRRAAGEALHLLAGVPIAVKDVVVTQGLPTTAGSKILSGWVPPYDATLVTRLRAAGLPILGKTNMDEFAMGSSTEHSAYGPTHNPWDLTRIPGGSGGGSAAALASFQAPLAIGTDTGGSIRQPASVTGTVGAKPTYGGVSRYGLIAMGGHDVLDSTSLNEPVPPVVEAARRADVTGMRIGIVKELTGEGFQPGVSARFDEAVQHLIDAGAQVVEVSCPSFTYALAAYYLVMPSEVSSNLAKFDAMRYGLRVFPQGVDDPSAEEVMAATRDAGFGAEVKRRIILGTYALSSGYYDAYYGSAQKVRSLIARDFDAAFTHADVLVSPTSPTTAFKFGDKMADPVSMYMQDIATIPANLAGVPGLSLPSGLADEDGLPAGFQILAPARKDERMYAVGAALEARLLAAWGRRLLDAIPPLPTDASTKA